MGSIKLDIGFATGVKWEYSPQTFNVDECSDIWRIAVSDHLHQLELLAAILQPDEAARANRYLRKEDHDRFIISRASLRFILSRYLNQLPAGIIFHYGTNKKPYVPKAGIHYNLSDSGDQILIAVSKFPVGIDVEFIKPRFYYETILPLNFNQPEIAFINEVDSSQRFFMLWTRKEAILKATGIGLTDHLKQISALDGIQLTDGKLIATEEDWKLLTFASNDSYIATVATAPCVPSYNFYEFNYK